MLHILHICNTIKKRMICDIRKLSMLILLLLHNVTNNLSKMIKYRNSWNNYCTYLFKKTLQLFMPIQCQKIISFNYRFLYSLGVIPYLFLKAVE